jgi:ABC-type uncharacterized transport system ATPase subunit
VPSMTVAENLVMSRRDVRSVINWRDELVSLADFMRGMPFKVPLHAEVGTLAAGERQKTEIIKQLYLRRRFLVLDEPTSVLTPQEADEMLGLVRELAHSGQLTIVIITHKLKEVAKFVDEVTVLRRGRFAGAGLVRDLGPEDLTAMMIGEAHEPAEPERIGAPAAEVRLSVRDLRTAGDSGRAGLSIDNLTVHANEIVGIAGVSGNGQSELVEALSGQRPIKLGQVLVHDKDFEPTRDHFDKFKIFGLPEEPLKNATVPTMSVAENMAFRRFDKSPISRLGFWLSPAPMRAKARDLIGRYNVKTPSTETQIRDLSGGNVQRAVLARELSEDVDVLIVANPCFGLDFASVADIRAQIMEQRNRGAAVLLVSEDLDEILELSDRIAVMSGGKVAYLTPAAGADRTTIGRYMAGH